MTKKNDFQANKIIQSYKQKLSFKSLFNIAHEKSDTSYRSDSSDKKINALKFFFHSRIRRFHG